MDATIDKVFVLPTNQKKAKLAENRKNKKLLFTFYQSANKLA
jgi:hypothetical protein